MSSLMSSLDKCLDILRAAASKPIPIEFSEDIDTSFMLFDGEYLEEGKLLPISLRMANGKLIYESEEHYSKCENLVSAKLMGYALK